MNKPKVTKYFNENSKAWISSSYEGDGYDYPTARLRSEKTIEIISQLFQIILLRFQIKILKLSKV